jgi:hypothetical protein
MDAKSELTSQQRVPCERPPEVVASPEVGQEFSSSLRTSAEARLIQTLAESDAPPTEVFCHLCQLYTPAHDAESVDAFLDALSPHTQQRLTDAYLHSLFDQPQFPALQKVREVIEEHATSVLHDAVAASSATLCFSGYDSSSSLGRDIPLPGSDIDHWIVVVDGSEAQASDTRSFIRKATNPLIADLHRSSDAPPIVVTRNEVLSSLHLGGTADSFYLVRLPLEQWLERHQEWSQPGSTLSAKPYIHSSEKELIQLAGQFANDHHRKNWVAASCLVETIREGVTLENHFSAEEIGDIRGSQLYATSNQLKQTRNVAALQSKHRARDCFGDFDTLTSEEQFLLVRVFLEHHLRQDSTHNRLFALCGENPNSETLHSLIAKGFLSYRDPIVDAVVPEKERQNYQTLLPYLRPGTSAEAPFLNHYPFERDLPYDY